MLLPECDLLLLQAGNRWHLVQGLVGFEGVEFFFPGLSLLYFGIIQRLRKWGS